MTPETFIKHFETFAEAPKGIGKLRELILQLAVQGKLCTQNVDDEPALTLLQRIAAERKRKESMEGVRIQKSLPPISPDEVLYELPTGWAWERLGNIGDTNIGLTYSPQDIGQAGIPVLRSSNIQKGKIDLNDLVRVAVEPKSSALVEVGDLLICARNGSRALVGKVALVETLSEKTAFGAFMAIFRSVLNEYLYHFICSPLFRSVISDVNTTTINQITQSNLRSTLAPIPPLAEQRRIVEKVDQLLGLCDELAARQAARCEARSALVGATLDRLVSSAQTPSISSSSPQYSGERGSGGEGLNHSKRMPNHPQPLSPKYSGDASKAKDLARLRENFDCLFDTPKTIPQLRQAILQLAVQGQLVPQDPNDEPIDRLVTRVNEARRQFESGSSARMRSALTSIGDEELLFNTPPNWRWIRFGELANIVGGVTLGRKLSGRELASFPYLRVANVQQGRLDLKVIKYVEIPIDELQKYYLKEGDVLLTEGGDWDKLGRSAVWQGEIENCLHQNHIFRARVFIKDIHSEWLTLFTNSPVGRTFFQNAAKKTTNLASINMTQLRNCPVPIPTPSEQKRIVFRVTELLSLCDTLETKLTQAETASTQLLSAAVHQMLAGANANA